VAARRKARKEALPISGAGFCRSRNCGFLLAQLVLALAPLFAQAAEESENLVSIERGVLPAIDDAGLIEHLVSVDGRLVALGAGFPWILAADEKQWTRSASAEGSVIGVASKGDLSVALIGTQTGGVAHAEMISMAENALLRRALPRFPEPLDQAQATFLNGKLFVAGIRADGATRLFEIDPAATSRGWTVHAGWPGEGRLTSAAGQTFSLFITLSVRSTIAGDYETSATPGDRMLRWKAGEGWVEKPALAGTVVAGTATPIGQAHVLYLVRNGVDESSPAKLLSFHTITGSWATLDEPPDSGVRVGTAWKNGIVWQRSAADRATFEFGTAQVRSRGHLLHWLDWVVIVVYLVSMLGMGLYFYLREKRHSTADFFVGGRSIPFWAAGISLYAANTSSISYIAIPAKAFETNWQYLMNNLTAVVGLMFVAVWIVPLLRRLNLMSIFTYLETRFHPLIRTLASAFFILVQIGSRMSVILFLPSLAIATITGIDVTWSIMIMAVFTMIYTALGGMKAVVWTDFVQLIVKMGGIAFAIGFIVYMLDGGSGELLQIARAEEKMKLLDLSFDLTKATVWGFVFLVLFDVVLTFPKDQVLMQRVLSTRNDRDAGRSIWTFAAVMIPGGFMFYFVGTALYAYYKTHPERLDPLLTIDATFPLFIAAELPLGVKGLIIAGILAAAMATLSSIMNSVATVASVDFYEKLVKKPDPKVSVRFAEAMTVVTGLAGMGVALLLSRYDVHSLFDISIELAGLLSGGFAGAYTLGMFTRRANWQGVMIGVAVSVTLTTIAWWMSLVHPYFYLGISIMLCIIVGWLASWLFPPPPPAALAGLTIRGEQGGASAVAVGE